MVSPRWTKVRRDLWLHKARTTMVVLAITVGITGSGAVLDTWALLKTVTREEYLATKPVSATIQTDQVDGELLESVRAVQGVRAAEARRTVFGTAVLQRGAATAVLFSGSGLDNPDIARVVGEEGQWPPGDDAFVMEGSSASYANLIVGDSVVLQIGTGPAVTLPVTGVARDASLPPGWMEHVVYGFVTPATLARLAAPSTWNRIQIAVGEREMDREYIRRVASSVAKAVTSAGHPVNDVEVPEPGEHEHAAQMDSLLLVQGAFGMLALVLSGILVINLISAMLAGQVREIGILKTIGARTGQIAAMYLGLALALGLVASVVAIPVAAVVGRAYARFAAELLNFRVEGYSIPPRAILAQVLGAMVLPVVAAAIPVVRGCRISVAEALRDLGISAGGERPPGRLLAGIGGVGRPVLLSIRNAFRRRQRMALTLATLAMGGAVFMASLSLRTSIRSSIATLYGGYLRYDMSVRLVEPHDIDSLEVAVHAVAGVGEAEAWNGARASVQHGDGLAGNSFSVAGVRWDSPLLGFPPLEGRWLHADDGRAIVVSRRLAGDEPSLHPGATTTLIINGKPTTWTVIGVVDMGPAATAFARRPVIAELLGNPMSNAVVLRGTVAGLGAQAELINRLRGELERAGFPVETGSLVEGARQALEDHLLMVAGFLVLMSQLTIVVGGLGLASTMSLAVMERTREIGVLRAIGARHGTIAWMVQGEGLVIAVLSWALAVPLSIPMSVLVARAFGGVMLPVSPTLSPELSGVVIWLALVVVLSALACALPARHATHITTAQALAYE